MSIFGFYFVSELLREAGWPRKQGLFREDVLDTTVLDSAVDQMIDWSAALGAGRLRCGLQVIAEMFRDRSWDGVDAPNIRMFIDDARSQAWNVSADTAPHEIIQRARFAKSASTVDAKNLTDRRLRVALEQLCLEGILWGIENPSRFETWYRSMSERHARGLPFMHQAGLAVDALPNLPQFLAMRS